MSHQEENESLLDVTLKKYPKESMKKIFNLRLFIVTKTQPEPKKENICNYLNKWCGQSEVDPILGMSYLYPGCTIHLLQSSTEKMFTFLRALLKEKEIHEIWPIKILLSTDNVPPDTFKFYHIVQIETLKQDSFTANAPIEISIAEVYNAFLSLTESLSQMGDQKRKDALENLLREYNIFLPADFRVLGFAENKDVCLLEEYLEIFDMPVTWSPALETSWPPQKRHDLKDIEFISEVDSDEQKAGQ